MIENVALLNHREINNYLFQNQSIHQETDKQCVTTEEMLKTAERSPTDAK